VANQAFFELGLLDTRSEEVEDRSVRVTFKRQDGQVIFTKMVSVAPRVRFGLPAFPEVHAIFGLLEPSRFRTREIPFFSLTHDETAARALTVFRQPSSWTANFASWAQITKTARDLADVLRNSPDIRVKGWKSYPMLIGPAYDNFGSDREDLPKSSLLNIYTRLTTTSTPAAAGKWFSYVRQLLELGRERVIAIVDEKMGTIVQKIRESIENFPGYRRASADLHHENFPARYGVLKKDLFSVKTDHENGNLQLTLGPGTDETGKRVLLLDVDIDENGQWLKHTVDVFKHKFTGGTHPFDIHEALALENPSWPVGYRLV
jgi:hypothetical protein